MSSVKFPGFFQSALRRLDLLYLTLATFDLVTIIAALILNYAVTNAFQTGVETSNAWSQRQAQLVELSRLAQGVDAPGNDVFMTGDTAAERTRRDVALRHFDAEWRRFDTQIRERPLSPRDDELSSRLLDVRHAMAGLVAHSEHIFELFQHGQTENAARSMAEMDRAYAVLGTELDRALAVVEREREEHLNRQLQYARDIRGLEILMALAIVVIICLLLTYGWQIARSLRQNQEQRARMLQELAEARDRLHHYADDVSHELRGPISKMRLDLELVLSRKRSPSEYQSAVEGILDECEQMSNIVECLLFLARADSQQVAAMKRRIDLEREIALIIDFYGAAAEQAGVFLTAQFDTQYLNADRSLLQRAIGNLISNAIAHAPGGGAVQIHVHRDNDWVVVDVTDSGAGMSEEGRRRAFERFYRGDDARGRSGLGLGLAITKAIMDLHGGTISLLANPQGGTRAQLRFPHSAHETLPQ